MNEIHLSDINYLAVAAAVVVNMAAGAAWYSPLLFARPWMAANGFTEEQIREQGSATRGYVVSVIVSVVLSLPTLGPILLDAILIEDTQLAGFIVLLLGILTVVGTLISDILLAVVDPRIKFSAQSS